MATRFSNAFTYAHHAQVKRERSEQEQARRRNTAPVCELCGGTGWVQGDHSVYEPPSAGAEWCPRCHPVPVVVLADIDDYEPPDISDIDF